MIQSPAKASAKTSISSWWILGLMSMFLWYRNHNYDRALAVFVFTLGLVQLIEYGVYSGTDPIQSGRAIFIIMWLECLILAIGVYVLIQDMRTKENTDTGFHTTGQNVIYNIAGWNVFLFSIIFIIGLVTTYFSSNTYSAHLNPDGHIEWTVNNRPMLEQWGWLYALGILLPLCLLFGYYMWADIGLAVLIVYTIVTAAYVLMQYPLSQVGNVWTGFSVGFAFLAWFTGLLTTSHSQTEIFNKDVQ